MIEQREIQLPVFSRGFHLITQQIEKAVLDLPETALLHIFICHTSAALTINENYDPSVLQDMEAISNHLVPENQSYYTHTLEGSDDMPAHFKSSMMGSSVSIPVKKKRMALGTWQGIYLCEFRNQASARKLIITILS